MCAMLMGVPAGKPASDTLNVAFAAVMLPEASFVRSHVTVTDPLPVASGPETGGTSFAGSRAALKIGLAAADGAVVESLLHAATDSAIPREMLNRRFIIWLLLGT